MTPRPQEVIWAIEREIQWLQEKKNELIRAIQK